MAAEVGVAVLSSFLQVAFDRFASADILHFFKNRGLNETLLKRLEIMLRSLNTVIDDAEYKQFTDSNVKAWLLELKDAVYDAEDLLDAINYELYKHKVEAEAEADTQTGGDIAKVRKLFNSSASSFVQEIESRMKLVLETLEFLEARKINLGLKEGVKGGALGSATQLQTTSLVDEARVYGRDEDKDIIIKGLLKDSHFSVMSIVGMAGLGKTTLAQLVYNDQRIQSAFDLTVWVCVSDDFDVFRLTKQIFNKIMPSNNDTDNLDTLQTKLKDGLSGKKFLIVLDDVWCDDFMSWEALQKPFICGAAGSRILVTTRSETVATKAARSDEIYHPKNLKELPAGLHKLKNLHQLDLQGTRLKKIPPNLGELKNLQVRLTSFYVGKCIEPNIKQLGELNLTGQLSICALQNVAGGMDALKANLKEKKKHLEGLSFEWNQNDNTLSDRDVLEKLQPHQNLKKLSIKCFGGAWFPGWFGDKTALVNIVSLHLESCKYCSVLPSLGLLASLKSLVIIGLDGIVAVDADFFGSNSCVSRFASLETMEFSEMENWKKWDCTASLRAFPNLKQLQIIVQSWRRICQNNFLL